MAKAILEIPGGLSRIITRTGNEIAIKADEVTLPDNELGLVRFRANGKTVGVAFASQLAMWWMDSDE